jgi:hypothetical protein
VTKRVRRLLASAIALASVSVAVPAGAVEVGFDGGTRTCRFADSRINESSGIAVSSYDDRLLWTHNDSGDTARWFLVDTGTCTTRATYALDPALPAVQGEAPTALDWEDMARGTAADGTKVLLFADVGDNYEFRAGSLTVYEVAEPAGTLPAGADALTEQPVPLRAAYQLVYPGGPEDAESLAVLPSGRLVVVTKDRTAAPELAYSGHSRVYATTGRPGPGPNVMVEVATLDATALPGAVPGQSDSVAFTAVDISRDGRHLVVRTYRTAYEYDVPAGEDLAAAFDRAPRPVPLLSTKQGEGIAYTSDAATFLTSSEGSGADGNPESGVLDRYARLTAPTPVVPEAPPWLLPLLGALVLGGGLRWGRRRSSSTAPVVPAPLSL